MKPTPTTATPAMKTINGKKCVRVLDLAKKWGTSTATILATDKPNAVPDRYTHRINGRAWCELEGLRLRADAVKDRKSSYISREIIEFLDGLEKPETTAKPTDLDTTVADARRAAYQALVKAEENANLINETDDAAWEARRIADGNRGSIGSLLARMDRVSAELQGNTNLIGEHSQRLDKLENTVNKLKSCDHVARHQSASATVVSDKNTGRIQELSEIQDRLTDVVHANQERITDNATDTYVVNQTANKALDTATQAADLAQENADIVAGEIERLTRLAADVDRMKKKAHTRNDDAMARIIQTERNQRDNAARIATLEEHARAVDWTLAALAALAVIGRVIHLLHRR